MPALAVVLDFDPGKEHTACLGVGRKGEAVDLLALGAAVFNEID